MCFVSMEMEILHRRQANLVNRRLPCAQQFYTTMLKLQIVFPLCIGQWLHDIFIQFWYSMVLKGIPDIL